MASSPEQLKRLLRVSDLKYDIDIEIGQSKITTSASDNQTIVKPEPVCVIDELLSAYKLEVSGTARDLPHQRIDLKSEGREIKNELFTCFECQRHFLTKDDILNHATSGFCGGVCCDACSKEFLTSEELVDHLQVSCSAVSGNGSGIMTRNVESPNAVIDKFDETSSQLAILESTQELKTCDHCMKTFPTKKKLKRHMRSHQPIYHKCDVCLKVFHRISILLSHRRKVHGGTDPLECEICKQTFSSRSQRMLHMRTHKTQQSYCCKICEKSFPFLSKLKAHEYLTHTDDRHFKCESCGKQFRSNQTMKGHQNTCGHIHSCKICSRTFTSLRSIANHTKTHKGKDSFDCKICLANNLANNCKDCGLDRGGEESKYRDCCKAFPEKTGLVGHVHFHHIGLPNRCEICGLSFLYKSRKIQHMMRHSVERPYKCELCESRFKSKPQLVTHIRRHTGEKLFHCEFCEKKFFGPSELKNHAKVHSAEVPYKCDFCEKRFKWKYSRDGHRRTHTGERPFGCKLCDKTFSTAGERRSHAILHLAELPFKCDFCETRFRTKDRAEAHRRAHMGEKPFVCNVCGKTSSSSRNIREHSKSHLEGMPFILKCEFCSQRFQTKKQLSTHTKSEHLTKKMCDVCGLIFKDLKYHSKIVHGNKLEDSDLKIDIEKLRFKCKVGEVRCRTETRLKTRMIRTHGGNGYCYKCDDCWKGFSTKARLVSHIGIHCVALTPAFLTSASSV